MIIFFKIPSIFPLKIQSSIILLSFADRFGIYMTMKMTFDADFYDSL